MSKTRPWGMARVASRRPLPKPRKMMGPVGPASFVRPVDGDNWYDAVRELGIDANRLKADACTDCGYHVCSCYPYALPGKKPPSHHPNGCPCRGCLEQAQRQIPGVVSSPEPPAPKTVKMKISGVVYNVPIGETFDAFRS